MAGSASYTHRLPHALMPQAPGTSAWLCHKGPIARLVSHIRMLQKWPMGLRAGQTHPLAQQHLSCAICRLPVMHAKRHSQSLVLLASRVLPPVQAARKRNSLRHENPRTAGTDFRLRRLVQRFVGRPPKSCGAIFKPCRTFPRVSSSLFRNAANSFSIPQ
jgi:hypothetical protein